MSDHTHLADPVVLSDGGLLLHRLRHLDPQTLAWLAADPTLGPVPSFRGRCLDAAYLDAVADGTWGPDDEAALAACIAWTDSLLLPKTAWRHRRAVRRLIASIAVAASTAAVRDDAWQRRRAQIMQSCTPALLSIPLQRTS